MLPAILFYRMLDDSSKFILVHKNEFMLYIKYNYRFMYIIMSYIKYTVICNNNIAITKER